MIADHTPPYKKRSILDVRRESREAKSSQPPKHEEEKTPSSEAQSTAAWSSRPLNQSKLAKGVTKPKKERPPPPPYIDYIDIKASCGHTIKLAYWAKISLKSKEKLNTKRRSVLSVEKRSKNSSSKRLN